MRIVIDLQGCQSEGSRMRGIGRYSAALIKALIKNQPDNQYILFANSSLRDLRDDFKNEITSSKFNVDYFQWYSPGPINNQFGKQEYNNLVACELRGYSLSLLDADIFLITSYFEGFLDNCLTDISNLFSLPPKIAIIYDLIPLINKNLYLDGNPPFSKFYSNKLENICKFDSLFSISDSSKNEAKRYLSFDPKKIWNISSACDQTLFNSKVIDSSMDSRRFNFKYLLYSGAGDPRKNLKRLIHAYEALPRSLREEYKLVLVGHLLADENKEIKDWIKRSSIKSECIKIVGFVTDKELVDLYRNCSLFIFPSLHEGFGLPVLEAMSCGAPVIGSNTSSIPEIIGDTSAMFDPLDTSNISSLLEKALVDTEFRSKLLLNSKNRSKLFSWEETSKKCLHAFRKIILANKKNKKSFTNTKSNYSILINRINSILYKLKSKQESDLILKQISACIQLINNQAKKYNKDNTILSDEFIWRVEGPFDSNYSLSILNRQFALAIKRENINVKLLSTEGPGDFKPDLKFLKNWPEIFEIYKDSKINDNPNVISRNLYPPRVKDFECGINILHSYGWEESEFLVNSIQEFNENLDGISVMSKQVKKILIDNGINLPIKVTSLGVDHIQRTTEKINLDVKSFRFLHVSSCFPRKGIDILLSAYGESFSSYDDVSLIIKTTPNPHNNVKKILNNLISSNDNYPHVLVLEEDFSDINMSALYDLANVLVAPSFGEGFGLPIAEAMSLGLPVITTAWGGQTDFCNDSNSWLIDFSFEYAKTHFNLTSSVWARPSKNHLSDLLKEVYSSSNEKIRSKTIAAQLEMKQYTWENSAKQNISFVQSLSFEDKFKESRIGWISTFNSRCGIAAYSKHLLEYISDFKIILTPNDEESLNNENLKVKRCWDIGDSELSNFDELYKIVVNQKLTTIVLQFNYGFYNYEALKVLINNLINKKIKIIIMIHSTKDPIDFPEKKLQNLVDIFIKCNRILVHTPDDLNQLRKLGLIENTALFPHGILDFHKNRTTYINSFSNESLFQNKLDQNKKNITTYGYCLPNKGFFELINAVSILKERGFIVDLKLFCAFHSSIVSKEYHLELLDLIDKLSISDQIILDTSFYTDQETLLKLSQSDLIVYPYQNSNESSSASVRHGIASGIPVLVTPISIFNDVSSVVDLLPGISSDLIANGIENWYLEKFNKGGNKILTDYQHLWREQHRFSKLGNRLQGLIRSIEQNI